MPSQVISAVFAMSTFIVALIAGMAAGNPASVTLTRAVFAMVLMYLVGGAIGLITQRIVSEHANRYRVRAMSGLKTSGEPVEKSVQAVDSFPKVQQKAGH
ncbi:MAG: hypothetical protein AABZ53_03785 [Planctomycetota bacterium]